MAERGDSVGVGAVACPFVALELDRDRRSDRPDYRHRCFAEPTPQPRAIAHQAAYCLSPNFAACPIFQDWAVRAAAQPTATSGAAAAGVAGAAAAGVAGAGVTVSAAAAEPDVVPALPADIQPELPAPGEAWPAEAFAPTEQTETAEQLSVFSAPGPAEQPVVDVPEAAPPYSQPEPSRYYSSEPAQSVRSAPMGDAFVQPGSGSEPDSHDAPVPGFLAGRPPRPARSSRPGESTERVSREDLIPSWERDGRFGAEPAERERTDRFGGIVTAIAVIAILALGVAGVIFLPGLLAGGVPTRTPPVPSVAPSGGVLPSAIVSPVATLTPSPTSVASAAPTPTPFVYRVRRGDTLLRIARKFDVTVDDILAANPQITDADHIEPGDLLTIPPPPDSLPSAEPSAAP